MNVKELVEFVDNSKNKMLKEEQLKTVLKKKLEVKEYLSIKEKKNLVNDIINECILYEDGVYKFDDTDKYICFIMKTIEAYTNLELSDDIEEDYDMLCKSKMFEQIISIFKTEYDEVNILLQMKCDYILSENNIEIQVGRFLNGIMDKLDDFVDILKLKIGDFDMSKLPVSKNELNKLIDFIDSQK